MEVETRTRSRTRLETTHGDNARRGMHDAAEGSIIPIRVNFMSIAPARNAGPPSALPRSTVMHEIATQLRIDSNYAG